MTAQSPPPLHAARGLAPLPGGTPQARADLPELGIVTGDAVRLDMSPAGVLTRGGAFLLDAVVLILASVLVGALGSGLPLDDAWMAAFRIILAVLALVVWPVAMETLTRGLSLGKIAMGLRVVRDDGGPIRFRQAFIRVLVGLFELWGMTGFPAVICALFNRRGKRVGDLLAGTYVVTERPPQAPRASIHMPPGLASWAAAADLGPLPPALTATVRQVLARRHTMRPDAVAHSLDRLAHQVAARVQPAPPPGVPADVFLTAVLAEHRRRDLDRLTRLAERSRAREHQLHGLPYGLD